MAKRNPVGRPPRSDRPTRIEVRLPGSVRDWLRRRAAREGRHEGDIIATDLELLRARRLAESVWPDDWARPERVLKAAMIVAWVRGYRGPGADWKDAPPGDLLPLIEAGEHLSILQSPKVSRLVLFDRSDLDNGQMLADALAESKDPIDFLWRHQSLWWGTPDPPARNEDDHERDT